MEPENGDGATDSGSLSESSEEDLSMNGEADLRLQYSGQSMTSLLGMHMEGAYDPNAYQNLNVKPDVEDLFKFIAA